jgi:hypothetical protein
VPIMPQIRPALVLPRPAGSILPASIALRSVLPMIQAGMPRTPQTIRLRMPRTRMSVPRCGCITLATVHGAGPGSKAGMRCNKNGRAEGCLVPDPTCISRFPGPQQLPSDCEARFFLCSGETGSGGYCFARVALLSVRYFSSSRLLVRVLGALVSFPL